MEGWVVVYSSNLQHRVDIVVEVLKDQGISAVPIDKRDSSYIMLGEIELYVKNDDAILSKVIIEQNQL